MLSVVTVTRGHPSWGGYVTRHTDLVKDAALPRVLAMWRSHGWEVEGVVPATVELVHGLMRYDRNPILAEERPPFTTETGR